MRVSPYPRISFSRRTTASGIPALALLALLALAPSSRAHVDQYIDGESATISGAVLTDNGQDHDLLKANEGAYTVLSSTPVYAGARSIKSYIPAATDHAYDRSETVLKDAMPMSTHRVVGFSVYVPSGFPSGQGAQISSWLVFSQFWQFNPAMPAITLEVAPNTGASLQYQLVVRNDDTKPFPDSPGCTPWPVRTTGPLATGTWTRFVLEMQTDPVGTAGYVKLYMNGTLQYTYNGKVGYSTTYTTTQTLNVRTGIYRTGGESTFWWPATALYFDEIKYGDTLSEVL